MGRGTGLSADLDGINGSGSGLLRVVRSSLLTTEKAAQT